MGDRQDYFELNPWFDQEMQIYEFGNGKKPVATRIVTGVNMDFFLSQLTRNQYAQIDLGDQTLYRPIR